MTVEANLWNKNNSAWREVKDSPTIALDLSVNHEARFSIVPGSVGATQLTDASVSNAKLANMAQRTIKARKTLSTGAPEDCTLSEVLDFITSAAQGDILYRGASAWARLPAANNGQVLQLAAGLPSWADRAFELLNSTAASGASNVDFSIPSGIGALLLLGSNITVSTDNARVDLRFSQSGSFLSGASDYKWSNFSGQYGGAGTSLADTADNEITVANDVGNVSASEYAEFSLLILRPLASGTRKSVFGHVTWLNGSTQNIFGLIHAQLLANTSAIDGLRILPSAGTVSGTLDLYGMRT